MVTFGGFVGLSGYLPLFMVDRFELTKVTGAGYAALCAAAGSLLRPLGGVLGDGAGSSDQGPDRDVGTEPHAPTRTSDEADHPVRPSGGRAEVHAAAALTERP